MGIPRIEPLELHATLPSGPRNLITDVAGVRVGHATVQQGEVNTGVTAVLPHPGNLFLDKVMASAAVINGFGKSAGILQVQELGTIETPILLTNTHSVGTAFTGLCRFDLLTASGNTKVANSASNLASLITFGLAGKVMWAVGSPAALCGIAGNYVGSGLALKGGAKVIRPMFFVVLTLLVARLVYGLVG